MLPGKIVEYLQHLPISSSGLTLETRLGRTDSSASYTPLCQKDQIDEIYRSWNDFHNQITYKNFNQFYSKECFCNEIDRIKLSRECFIEFICDRVFLFLSYSSHLAPPDYPEFTYSFLNKNAAQWFDPEKVETIREHGFMPTRELRDDWNRWKRYKQDLNQAIKRREEHILRGPNLPLGHTVPMHIDKSKQSAYSELSNILADLFNSYIIACQKTAYCAEYAQFAANPASTSQKTLPWIDAILSHVRETNSTACAALWIWVLFTSYTTKLAKGTLKKFTFKLPPCKQARRDSDPAKQQATQSVKTQCNIILFDHLLDLLPPPDIEYAKFQFYALTQYNRFTHYDTKPSQPFNFNCPARPMDCIDQLGGMIRYHIEHCLMNTPAWLTLAVPSISSKPLMNSLSALLLHDASLLPVNRRLTDRVRLLMSEMSPKAESYILSYSDCEDSESKTNLLDRIIAEENLHFVGSHVFMDNDTLNDPNIRQCERFVLEYALKDKAIQGYHKNLRAKAKELFPKEWFLSDHVFSE